MSLLESARTAVALAQRLGAQEARAVVSRGSEVELEQRARTLERVKEASTLGLSMSLMVDGKFSSHSTSDLRPAALEAFLGRAVAGTRYLEEDPDRTMLPLERMGSLDIEDLDVYDGASLADADPSARRATLVELEDKVLGQDPGDLVSAILYGWDASSESACVFSNGFEGESRRTHFGFGVMVTMKEPSGKLPEAYSFLNASHRGDLPTLDALTADVWDRATLVRETSACKSEQLPLLLDARVASRLLGQVLAPLSGSNVHHGRSLYLGRLGEQLGSSAFTVIDDPTVPRGMGSKPFDGDGLKAQVRPIFEEGRLKTFFLDNYHARKLKMPVTTGGTSNIVIAPGQRTWQEMAAGLARAIRITSFLGGNSNPASGDYSLGIRGQLLEHGEPVQNLSEMNITGNLVDLIACFEEAATDTWVYGSYRVPTLLFGKVQFSGL